MGKDLLKIMKQYGYMGLILVGIGFLSFLPRVLSLDVAWSSDETVWMNRSRNFMLSVLDGDFSDTLQSYHPGVTTMWLGGISLWAKYKHALSVAPSLRSSPFLSPSNLARTRLTIAITTGCVVLIAFFLLQKLLGTKIATIAGVFLAVDPIYLAQSRRLHTDALAANFLLLAILTLLIFLKTPNRLRYLLFSGVCFGLACLSKSNALVLAFWVPLLLTLSIRQVAFTLWFSRAIYTFLAWLGTACVTFIGLWPALWSYRLPIGGIQVPVSGMVGLGLLGLTIWSSRWLKYLTTSEYVVEAWHAIRLGLIVGGGCFIIAMGVIYKAVQPFVDRIGWALTTEHEVAHFFLGKIRNDPGWLFYPLMLSIKSAPLTFPLFLIGFVLLWRQRHQPHYAMVYRISVAFSIFVILFTFCMSIGAKKFDRYLLPVFPIMDLLAAIGLYVLGEKFFQLRIFKWPLVMKTSRGRILGALTIGLVFLIQVIPVLSVHPYYGTYYNPLWGITDMTKVCTLGDASGLDIAANYLNQKPGAENLTVRVSPLSAEFFGYYFQGRSYRRDLDPGIFSPDYEVAYIRDVQINRVRLKEIEGTLEHVIRLNGIDYVWIYQLPSSQPERL